MSCVREKGVGAGQKRNSITMARVGRMTKVSGWFEHSSFSKADVSVCVRLCVSVVLEELEGGARSLEALLRGKVHALTAVE